MRRTTDEATSEATSEATGEASRAPRTALRATALAALAVTAWGPAAGCSLLLDFDSEPPVFPPDECAYGEPNDTRETAAPLSPGEVIAAALCRPDVDYYALEIPAGRVSTRIDLRFVQAGAQGNLDMRLFDGEGRMRASSLSTDSDEQIRCPSNTCEDLPVGTYVLEIREEVSSTTGARYQLEVTAR